MGSVLVSLIQGTWKFVVFYFVSFSVGNWFSKREDIIRLHNQINKLKEENENLFDENTRLKISKDDHEAQRIKILKRKNMLLESELSASQIGLRKSDEEKAYKIREVENRISEKDAKLKKMYDRISDLENECFQLREQLSKSCSMIEENSKQEQHELCIKKLKDLEKANHELQLQLSSARANLDSMERDLKIIQKDNTAKNELLRAQQNYANDTRKKEFESQLRSVKDNERSTQQIIMNYEREMDVLKKSSDNDIKRLELELKKANERLLEVGHEWSLLRNELIEDHKAEIYRITSRHERILRDKEEEVKKAHMKILDVQKEYAARLESMTAAIRSEVDEVKSAYSQMAKESEGGSAAIVSRLYTNFQEVLRKQQKMLNEARNRERLMLEALRSGQFNTFYNEQEEYEDGGPGVEIEEVLDE